MGNLSRDIGTLIKINFAPYNFYKLLISPNMVFPTFWSQFETNKLYIYRIKFLLHTLWLYYGYIGIVFFLSFFYKILSKLYIYLKLKCINLFNINLITTINIWTYLLFQQLSFIISNVGILLFGVHFFFLSNFRAHMYLHRI